MKKGFSTLFIVIILGSLALGLVITLSTSSFWSIRSSTNSRNSAQARALVNSCAEIALETIRINTGYVGTNSENILGSTCVYTVSNAGGNNRTIIASSTVGTVVRKLNISTSAFNPLVISSWQEVP